MKLCSWSLVAFLLIEGLNSTVHTAQKSPASGKAALVHDYKEQDNQLIDVSSDGRLALIETRKSCPHEPANSHQFCTVFIVYDTGTGQKVGQELALDNIQNGRASFDKSNRINFFEVGSDLIQEWDPTSGKRLTLVGNLTESIKTTQTGVLCSIGPGRFLALGSRRLNSDAKPPFGLLRAPDYQYTLETLDSAGLHELQQPIFHDHPRDGQVLHQMIDSNCHSWKAGTSYLIPYHDDEYGTNVPGYSRKRETNLFWISTDPRIPPRLCRSFNNEFLYGHAISPDGSIIAAVTSEIDLFGLHVRPLEAFLNVLDAATCSTLRRTPLSLPDGESVGGVQFARQRAISPDNRHLALSFGRFNDSLFGSTGRMFFALYSLSDGHWQTTLSGDQTRGARRISLSGAPIIGDLLFSPDSRFLFATSWHVRQWDVSSLR